MGRELCRAEQGDLLQGLLSPEAGITSSLLYTHQGHPRSFATSTLLAALWPPQKAGDVAVSP